MKQSVFYVAKMDCPTEEGLIRKRLQSVTGVAELRFNLLERELTVTHGLEDDGTVVAALEALGMEPERRGVKNGAERQSVFHIANMDCAAEEQLIRNGLGRIAGVERLDFDLMQRELAVTHSLGEEQVLQALVGLGMEATPIGPASATGAGTPDTTYPSRATALMPKWLLLSLSGATAVVAEVVAWSTGAEHSPWVIGLALLSIAVGGRDTLRKGWVAIRNRTLNINFLMSLAILGAVVIGQWPEAAMVTFLFTLAERIEGYSLERARDAIRGLMELTPETATVRDPTGDWREVAAAAVAVGQTVRVRPGERVPLDGTVTAGQSTVNQAPITGESIPVEKGAGDPVFAGTVNERGSFEFEVTSNQGNTTLDRIVRAVQAAQADRAPTQRFVDRFARYYTPVVVALAGLVAVLPPLFFGQPFAPWLYKALVLLVIACPCALVLSTPITLVSGLAAAARCGILVKGGSYLEEGRRLRAVALDKTGTLTLGRPSVTDVVPLNGMRPEEALHLAASLNARSEHPVASAIVSHCAIAHGDRKCDLLPVTEFEALAGRGAKGTLAGHTHYVGSHRLAHDNQVCSAQVEEILTRLEREGKTTVILTNEHESLAVFGVADTLREASVQAVRELHALGIRTVMLTGDNATTAHAIAEGVGIDDARGNLLPEDKLRAVTELREKYGSVGMVGDGINDAPALAQANIGFAMGAAGTATALETADVALMEDDLRKLPQFIRLSRAAGSILTQNIALSILIKVVFFGLALAGRATLWMAVFADMGGSLLVVFNGLRLLRYSGKAQP